MKIRIGLALFAVYVFWGSTYLAISIAVQTIPPFLMAGTRFLVAGSHPLSLAAAARRSQSNPAGMALGCHHRRVYAGGRQWRADLGGTVCAIRHRCPADRLGAAVDGVDRCAAHSRREASIRAAGVSPESRQAAGRRAGTQSPQLACPGSDC